MIEMTTVDKEGRAKIEPVILVPKDYVPVVRCKDCKHWCNKREDGGFDCCTRAIVNRFKPTDFCSYGERKEE